MRRFRPLNVATSGLLGVTLATAGFAATPAGADTSGAPATTASPNSAAGVTVNLALTGSVTAASATAGHGPALAADGDAASTWCPTGSAGTLVVDLGRPRPLAGFGVTLAGGSADVSIEIAAAAGQFRVAQPAVQVAGGTPTWFPQSGAGPAARWIRLSVAGTGGATPCVGELRALGHVSGPAPIQGHDMSFAVQESAAGATYTDLGAAALPEQILADHGANYVRLRLWVDPPPGYSDLDSVLTMARRAKAAGMRLLLDFHYSDFWADPQKQPIPAAWAGQDLSQLADTVRAYTRDVLDALAAQGTPADMVQLGNEIRNGMLWPLGYIDWSTGTGWDNLGTLLRAASDGVRDSVGPMPKLMVHFDQGGDNGWSRAFFDHIVAQRVPFDVIGVSYYPFWHGTMSQLRANVNDLSARYDRDVVIAETQYGWTLANGDKLGNFLWQSSQLVPGYPASPDGQLAFLSDLASIMAAVPDRHGVGIFYWQPEWIPGVGWAPGEGTPNDNLTLFDFTGHALPSVDYADPLRACATYAAGQDPCSF
jgi:arabinogalactan endo-1,4-beta-galactosidase